MTKIKLCGISRMCDIDIINQLKPDYIGFVFAKKSKRYVSYETADMLRQNLAPDIKVVGVFVNESEKQVATLLNKGIIDIAQLHGDEDENYMSRLREISDKPVIKAFCVSSKDDITGIEKSSADYLLLDSGAGSGECFDWGILKDIERPFFLAGGLDITNVEKAIRDIGPFAVDVSSGIETNGLKDENKMREFVEKVNRLSAQL